MARNLRLNCSFQVYGGIEVFGSRDNAEIRLHACRSQRISVPGFSGTAAARLRFLTGFLLVFLRGNADLAGFACANQR